jgi:hypothetical protein
MRAKCGKTRVIALTLALFFSVRASAIGSVNEALGTLKYGDRSQRQQAVSYLIGLLGAQQRGEICLATLGGYPEASANATDVKGESSAAP